MTDSTRAPKARAGMPFYSGFIFLYASFLTVTFGASILLLAAAVYIR